MTPMWNSGSDAACASVLLGIASIDMQNRPQGSPGIRTKQKRESDGNIAQQ
jgi:hypothetical protein